MDYSWTSWLRQDGPCGFESVALWCFINAAYKDGQDRSWCSKSGKGCVMIKLLVQGQLGKYLRYPSMRVDYSFDCQRLGWIQKKGDWLNDTKLHKLMKWFCWRSDFQQVVGGIFSSVKMPKSHVLKLFMKDTMSRSDQKSENTDVFLWLILLFRFFKVCYFEMSKVLQMAKLFCICS